MPDYSGQINSIIPMRRLSRAGANAAPVWYDSPSGDAGSVGIPVGMPVGTAGTGGGSGGGGGAERAAAAMQLAFSKIVAVAGTVSTALNMMASVVKTQTTEALIGEARQRGELSKAMQSEMKFSREAEYYRAIPVIGGAMGNLAQAQHEQFQQQVGSQYTAATAGILENRIAGLFSARDQQSLSIASGRIADRFAADPLRAQLEQERLGIRYGDAGRNLIALEQGRERVGGLIRRRRAELEALPDDASTDQQGVAVERLMQAQNLMGLLNAPAVRVAESQMRANMARQEELAGKAYLRGYSLRMAPATGTSYAAFARGPGAPTAPPPAGPEVQSVRIVAMDAEVQRALEGLNGMN